MPTLTGVAGSARPTSIIAVIPGGGRHACEALRQAVGFLNRSSLTIYAGIGLAGTVCALVASSVGHHLKLNALLSLVVALGAFLATLGMLVLILLAIGHRMASSTGGPIQAEDLLRQAKALLEPEMARSPPLWANQDFEYWLSHEPDQVLGLLEDTAQTASIAGPWTDERAFWDLLSRAASSLGVRDAAAEYSRWAQTGWTLADAKPHPPNPSERYGQMRAAGASPADIYKAMVSDGYDRVNRVWWIRRLFKLSLEGAMDAEREAGYDGLKGGRQL